MIIEITQIGVNMRIITGSAKGTNLITLDGEATRPTTEKVKEAVFSALQFELEGRRVLDLFAGSGQMGLEAVSRGAAKATMLDSSRDAVNVIIENAKKTKLFDKCRISVSDFAAFLKGAAGREQYDIIILDPPYKEGLIPHALELIMKYDILSDYGVVVCESEVLPSGKARPRKPAEREIAETAVARSVVFDENAELEAYYRIRRNAEYGRARITLLEKNADE